MPRSSACLPCTFPSACKIFSGVIRGELTRTPNGASASLMAFITAPGAPGAPAVPASPAPSAPSMEVGVGDCTWLIKMSVADVLRHRALNTTMRYAKLDSRCLAAVALPWPASAS